MSKAVLYKQLVIDDVVDKNTTTGYLTLKSSETIVLDRIKVKVFFEARGRMNTQKKTVVSFVTLTNKTLMKNVSEKIPFIIEFDATKYSSYNKFPDSYSGKNVTLAYKCETRIDVNENDLDKIDRSLLTKVKSFVTSDKSIKISKYFSVKNTDCKYEVVEGKSNFTLKTNILLSVIIGVVAIACAFYLIQDFKDWYIFAAVASIGLLIYLSKKYLQNVLGVVSLQTLKDEDAFLCNIQKTRRFNLTNQHVHYEIIEKVVDNRGTSSTSYSETLFKSEEQMISNFRSSRDLKFYFPERQSLQSFEMKDVSIIWVMYLTGEYFGLTLKYKTTFEVVRI